VLKDFSGTRRLFTRKCKYSTSDTRNVHKLKSHSNAEANLTAPIGFYQSVPQFEDASYGLPQTLKLSVASRIHAYAADWILPAYVTR